MKKLFVLVVCLTIMGIQSVNAQAAIAMLHHEGNVNMFSSAQAAIDNSVDGDTIYLSEGMFGEFTINKGIAVIGSGMKTIIAPNVNIDGSGIYLNNVSVSNLAIVNNILFIGSNSAIQNVKFQQCKISGNCLFNIYTVRTEFNMCHIQGQMVLNPDGTNDLSVINCKINEVHNGGESLGTVNFTNCNIKSIPQTFSYSERNNYINCIVESLMQGSFKNCLYRNEYDDSEAGCYRIDCYTSPDFTLDKNLECSLTDEQLSAAGYLGTDGTVVGITGGATPFTLASSVLRITDHNIEVDNEQRKLKVTLTLGTEE